MEVFEEGEGFQSEYAPVRVHANKQTGEVEHFEAGQNQPETDFFEFDDLEIDLGNEDDVKNFMAVKPWIGAIKEPDDHPPMDKSVPDEKYTIEHVYGYRCQDSRQNVYFNPDGNVVYPTACLGVILDKAANTQTFFGGGIVENTSKQIASDKNSHNNDIMCLKVNTNGDRQWAVTG